ncbi:MAG: hypothetical protein ACQSGP_17430 [Frankia sp.]
MLYISVNSSARAWQRPRRRVLSWRTLAGLATSDGVGRPRPPPSHRWAPGPGESRAGGNELRRALEQVPTERLVVLGEAAAGQAALLVRPLRDLLESRRRDGGPVLARADYAVPGQTYLVR